LQGLRASHNQAIYLAVTDTKTGLFNQHYLSTRMRSEIARAERAKIPVSFLMIDVNNLTQVNARFGFAGGDMVLDALGKVILKQLRATDIPSRWGADEFGVLLYNSDGAGATIVARRIADEIAATAFKDPESGRTFHVSMAQGIASYPHDTVDRTGNELTARALDALRRGKSQDGRGNSITVYSELQKS
jgi:diguanylate cyclase (GGDEF)-like protein